MLHGLSCAVKVWRNQGALGGWVGQGGFRETGLDSKHRRANQQHRQRHGKEGGGDGLIKREIFITEQKAIRRGELKLAGGDSTTQGFRPRGFPSRGK